ncbi:MAG: aldehyde dehydrogenase [Alistipes sp.]|nr:aldehyde dehydrogenase [Alistipes sp.]
MSSIIEIFIALGERLRVFGRSEESRAVIASAVECNPWFTERDIVSAVEAIRTDMLDKGKLEAWASKYPTAQTPQRVAIIMAGNIPLVGFFDLLCVLCSGHKAYIKLSSKDRVMMQYIVDALRDIESNIAIYDYSSEEHYDMVIATGGEDANRYFESHFANTKRLLRGSCHSVAVLDGKESRAELEGLFEDITAYSGLGCRSVSMIFAPMGHDIALSKAEAHNTKLRRNIASMRALYTLQGREFCDYGAFLAIEGKVFATSLANVVVQRYSDIAEVKAWLTEHSEQIQCVVSHLDIEGCVPFGEAQHPQLNDYADGVDTMEFLVRG